MAEAIDISKALRVRTEMGMYTFGPVWDIEGTRTIKLDGKQPLREFNTCRILGSGVLIEQDHRVTNPNLLVVGRSLILKPFLRERSGWRHEQEWATSKIVSIKEIPHRKPRTASRRSTHEQR